MKLVNLKFLSLVILFTVALISKTTVAQLQLPEDKVSWSFSIEQNGDEATVIGKIKMVKDWHVYAAYLPTESYLIPTKVELNSSSNFQLLGKLIEPKPILEHDEITNEDIFYHSNTIYLKQKIKITSEKDFTLKGKFSFQTCDDAQCLPPYETDFSVKVKGVEKETSHIEEPIDITDSIITSEKIENKTNVADQVEDKSTELKEELLEDDSEKETSMWGVFFAAFLSGFIALIMPCVFPMIPMTVSFFTKRSKTKAQGIKNAMIYGGSIVLIHVLLGGIVVITGAGELLNELSTNVYFNIFFFLMLFVFGLSFLGAFEIQLPASWVNKADSKADKGGVVGIFFMALVLSLASFSCTGPILGSLLGGLSSYGGGSALMVGMFAFGLALALPFMLFSIFPAWLNSMPSSGGWLNVVKVFLGFLEIAFAFKFLSTADTTMQWHLLEREIFISIWIAVFGTLTLYMFGKIRLPHDSPTEKLSVGRSMIGTFVLAFTIYLIPGLWGAPLKIVNAFLPPDFYAESPGGLNGNNSSNDAHSIDYVEGMHEGPQGIMAFKDYDKGLAYAKKVNKPLFVDFTGWGCVNCRKMEQSVWGEPGVIEHLRNDVVIVSLYVDERTELPKEEQGVVKVGDRDVTVNTIGSKWTVKQMTEYKTASQPYYVMQTPDGEDLSNGSADYRNHSNPEVFQKWLQKGLKLYKEAK